MDQSDYLIELTDVLRISNTEIEYLRLFKIYGTDAFQTKQP